MIFNTSRHYATSPPCIQLCQWLQKNQRQSDIAPLIVFTDEASFHKESVTNIHSSRKWAYSNPHCIYLCRHQHHFQLNVWDGIIGDNLPGLCIYMFISINLSTILTGSVSGTFLGFNSGSSYQHVVHAPCKCCKPAKIYFGYDPLCSVWNSVDQRKSENCVKGVC